MTVWIIERYEGDDFYDLIGTAEVRDGDDGAGPLSAQVELALSRLAIDEVAYYRVAPEDDPEAAAVVFHLDDQGKLTEVDGPQD